MRPAAVLMGAAALVLATAQLPAQAPPNFSAKWTLVPDPNAPPGGGRGGRGLGAEATIVQDGKTLTLTRTTRAGEVKTLYALDGSESKNTMTMGGNSMEQTSKAKWDGNKLVITTSMNMGGNPVESSMTLWLDPDGSLVVESTSPGRGGGAPTTTIQKYRKG